MYCKIRLDVPEEPYLQDVTCQHCGYVVEKGISREAINELIFYCPKCGSFIDT